MSARVEVYTEAVRWDDLKQQRTRYAHKWRWRFVSNGRVMADSGQGYSRRVDCLNGAATVLSGRFDQPQWIVEYGGVVTNGVIGYIYRHRAGDELDDWSHTFVVPQRDAITVHDLTREAKR